MTAAAARPPLFHHLVASRPEREGNSLSSTAASVIVHGVLIAAAVVATARVTVPRAAPEDYVIVPRPLEGPTEFRQSAGSSGGGTFVNHGPVPPEFPTEVPVDIPPVGPLNRAVEMQWRPQIGTTPGPTAGPGSGMRVETPGGEFIVLTVLPKLLNREDVQRAMTRLYPNILLQAGIGGTSVIWLRLDEEGRVLETQIKKGSGQRQLDDAALAIGRTARFSPALNGDVRVRVWIELPVVFSVGR